MPAMKEYFYSKQMQNCLTLIIIGNAITIGLQTFPAVEQSAGTLLTWLDNLVLGIFTLELLCRLYFERMAFFRSGWNWFDLLIVSIGYLPNNGTFTVFRLLRILRVLRLISVIPQLRIMIDAMLKSIPSLGWIVLFTLNVNYIFAVIGMHLYGKDFPNYFGTLPKSMYTMFELLTLSGWNSLARQISENHPYYFLFFIPYILGAAYIILNFSMGVLVNSMRLAQMEHAEKEQQTQETAKDQLHATLLQELAEISSRLENLENNQTKINTRAQTDCH